ncbi:nucleotidyltransferase domain-containing protein [Candidatus Woesearchaeota archaeon]|nr:nucleotidyltransferase domain-containing protein [Candidatus Woesearchaeota archaeon]
MLFTENERKVLKIIGTSGGNLSINGLSNEVNISAGSAYKVLTKFEKEEIITPHPFSNIVTYQFNFENEKTKPLLQLVYTPDKLEGKIKRRAEEFLALKKLTSLCIFFGSYITSKAKPSDLDVLFVIEKENYNTFKQALAKAQDITPVKIHDIVQTQSDLIQNLKKHDPIVVSAIQTGIVLWGYETLVQVIKDANQ